MSEAGYGAEQQAGRRARRVARLREEAARGEAIDDDVIRRAQAAQRNWSVGAEGERLVAANLAHLERYGWVALHDLRWPGRQRANIDHIAVGPGGIVVIDAKNWSGRVAVTEGDLRQNGYGRASSAEGVSQAAADVTALLAPQHRTAVRAVLCLAAQDQAPTPVQGVDVLGRWQLAEYLLRLPPRLSVFDVADVARYLEDELRKPVVPTPAGRARRQPGTAPRRPGTGRGTGRARGGTRGSGMSKRRATVIEFLLKMAGLFAVYQIAMHLVRSYASSIGG
ncbi:nuclease-related domain-containing protein [Cellulomonas dongxiuzhuiae]|uniref:nuclease-related domain-containing protein n=1 Tax=Cellulomonas dongxiuzhuiae TaxID=2819979 RepID=UPI001AAF171C|nr:nuclease-related domain-containing protein [Cellulomonas dongxiuzhuiae]MBO3089436.1 NERD domain-containing protein [Cellulomonas dongxiuzhuiae]